MKYTYKAFLVWLNELLKELLKNPKENFIPIVKIDEIFEDLDRLLNACTNLPFLSDEEWEEHVTQGELSKIGEKLTSINKLVGKRIISNRALTRWLTQFKPSKAEDTSRLFLQSLIDLKISSKNNNGSNKQEITSYQNEIGISRERIKKTLNDELVTSEQNRSRDNALDQPVDMFTGILKNILSIKPLNLTQEELNQLHDLIESAYSNSNTDERDPIRFVDLLIERIIQNNIIFMNNEVVHNLVTLMETIKKLLNWIDLISSLYEKQNKTLGGDELAPFITEALPDDMDFLIKIKFHLDTNIQNIISIIYNGNKGAYCAAVLLVSITNKIALLEEGKKNIPEEQEQIMLDELKKQPYVKTVVTTKEKFLDFLGVIEPVNEKKLRFYRSLFLSPSKQDQELLALVPDFNSVDFNELTENEQNSKFYWALCIALKIFFDKKDQSKFKFEESSSEIFKDFFLEFILKLNKKDPKHIYDYGAAKKWIDPKITHGFNQETMKHYLDRSCDIQASFLEDSFKESEGSIQESAKKLLNDTDDFRQINRDQIDDVFNATRALRAAGNLLQYPNGTIQKRKDKDEPEPKGNFEEALDAARIMGKHKTGRKVAGDLLMLGGLVLMATSIVFAVATFGFGSPASAMGIGLGAGLTAAGVAIGGTVAGASLVAGGLFSKFKKNTPQTELQLLAGKTHLKEKKS